MKTNIKFLVRSETETEDLTPRVQLPKPDRVMPIVSEARWNTPRPFLQEVKEKLTKSKQ